MIMMMKMEFSHVCTLPVVYGSIVVVYIYPQVPYTNLSCPLPGNVFSPFSSS